MGERENVLGLGAAAPSNINHSFKKEFETGYLQAAFIIGQNGQRIKTLEKRHNVQIVVTSNASGGKEGSRKITVRGSREEDVNTVLEQTQVAEENIDLDPEIVAWLLGQQSFGTVEEIGESCGLHSCSLKRNADKSQLQIVGTRRANREARLLLEAHMMYFEPFKAVDEEVDQLVARLKELGFDENGIELQAWKWKLGKGKDSPKGKGKDEQKGGEPRPGTKGKGRQGKKGSNGPPPPPSFAMHSRASSSLDPAPAAATSKTSSGPTSKTRRGTVVTGRPASKDKTRSHAARWNNQGSARNRNKSG